MLCGLVGGGAVRKKPQNQSLGGKGNELVREGVSGVKGLSQPEAKRVPPWAGQEPGGFHRLSC